MVQAKSGTGKTVAFACALLDSVLLTNDVGSKKAKTKKQEEGVEAESPWNRNKEAISTSSSMSKSEKDSGYSFVRALCVAPTREIALQTADVLRTLALACAQCSKGRYRTEMVVCFFGGVPVADDGRAMKKKPVCVVGTPGRLKQLVEMEVLRVDKVETMVLDEADQLLTKSGLVEDVLFLIHSSKCGDAGNPAQRRRQIIACSATFSKNAKKRLKSFLTSMENVSLCEETVALRGVKMCYRLIDSDGNMDSKNKY